MNPRHAHIGQGIHRLEDARFITGRGCFVGDLAPSGLLHAVLFRSVHAHGRLRVLDVSAARAAPGVHAVYTAADLGSPLPRIPMRMEPRPELTRFVQGVLALDTVRYAGEPLALIVAASRAQAQDALAAIRCEIDPLPAVTDSGAALAGAPFVFEEHATNHAMTLTAVRGDADAAFAGAAYTRRERFRVQRHTAVPMETRGLVADWRDHRLTLYGAAKVPFAIRTHLAQLLGLPESAVDVVENDAGGGFGARGEFYPEDFLIPFAARRLGRPVKWIEERSEHLLATTHAREVDCELEIACARDGTILALRGSARTDLGAYMRPNVVSGSRNLAQMIGGPYRVPHLRMAVAMVLTNKTPTGSYRGPGRFEADFCRERLLDIAARELGIDAVEFRRRNLLGRPEIPQALPNVLPYNSGGDLDSGDYGATFARCLDEFGWRDKAPLAGRLIDGRYHGLGVGCYIEGGSTGPREHARIVLAADGMLEVHSGVSSVGQGIETIFAQIAAEALGVPLARIRGVFHGSTTTIREGFGAFASRGAVMGGSAILDAAENLRRAIRETAARQFGCDAADVAIDDELAAVRAGGRARTLTELAPEGIEAEGCFVNSKRTYSYGTHAAHVSVDAATGVVEVLDYVAVEDVGRILNPHTLHGQTLGAIVQGLGAALREELVYDTSGQLLAGSLADYALPAAHHYPRIRVIALEDYPSPLNPLGAKGAGEGGIIPVGGVIANAVASALASLGVSPCALPLTSAKVWQLMRAAATPR
jgi:carbon-monoxide dehydrogenase large subunit